jgi:ABC-type transport system involved in multi-copper enzyme maturation permease subunit
LLAAGFGVVALAGGDRHFTAWVAGFQVAIGLLLFSAGAVTSLAEERAHGSLDLLLTTPLTTGQVLWGKWWGTFRVVPRLAVLPLLMIGPAVLLSGTVQSAALTAALILAYGAAFTSLGLALAVWVSRPGRAALLSATVCVLLTVGWLLFALLLFGHQRLEYLGMGSPWFGPGNLTFHARDYRMHDEVFTGALWWTAGYLTAAAALMAVAFRSFERCLGRVRQGRKPRSATR